MMFDEENDRGREEDGSTIRFSLVLVVASLKAISHHAQPCRAVCLTAEVPLRQVSKEVGQMILILISSLLSHS